MSPLHAARRKELEVITLRKELSAARAECVRLESERRSEWARAESWESVARLENQPAPCGHSDQFCYSPDGLGKVIRCSMCELATKDRQIKALTEAALPIIDTFKGCDKPQLTAVKRDKLERLSAAIPPP